MKRFAPVLLAAIAIFANPLSRSAPAVPEKGKALLVGTDTSRARVLFRKLDDGPILWTSPTTLGTTLSVSPGHHVINVMCHFKTSGMTRLVPGNLSVDVEAGHVYDVAGSLGQDGRICTVGVSNRS